MQVRLINDGDAPVLNANVHLPIPDDVDRLQISRGDITRNDEGDFEVPQIAAGQTMDFTVNFIAEAVGNLEAEAVASAYCVAEVRKPVHLNVRGIPALQVEVIDSADPVQVGENTTYEIKIINEGSAADLNIQLSANLPRALASSPPRATPRSPPTATSSTSPRSASSAPAKK